MSLGIFKTHQLNLHTRNMEAVRREKQDEVVKSVIAYKTIEWIFKNKKAI